jgi:LPS-assembly protein
MLSSGAAAQIPDGLRLKLEKQMRMAPPRPDRESAKFLEADRIQGDADRNVVATGNVTLRQRGATIRADRVEYHEIDQTVVATGGVRLERDGDVAAGPRLNYRLDNDTGDMDSPVFEFPKRPERRAATRGQASRAVLEENQLSRLFQAEYTSCPVPRDDWFIRVRELELDSSRNIGTAYNTTVYFLGLPILYSPYLSFPLDNKRKSGFLAPTLGTSAQSGFDFSLPYYFNLAENYDATLTPKLFSRRGIQLGAEFRYLTKTMTGQLDGEILPHDRVTDSDRYFLGLKHIQQLGHGFSFGANAQKVSDDAYFRDLSTRIALTSQTNLPRDAILAYNDETWSMSARALGYQTLQDPNAPPIPIPYNILPQLLAFGSRQNVYGFDWQLASELSNFRHPDLVNGQRYIAYP